MNNEHIVNVLCKQFMIISLENDKVSMSIFEVGFALRTLYKFCRKFRTLNAVQVFFGISQVVTSKCKNSDRPQQPWLLNI